MNNKKIKIYGGSLGENLALLLFFLSLVVLWLYMGWQGIGLLIIFSILGILSVRLMIKFLSN